MCILVTFYHLACSLMTSVHCRPLVGALEVAGYTSGKGDIQLEGVRHRV